ncbi:hypothetical protein Zmor_000816 [Zophobas morio]|uniref:Uncharacterized protein n=1 Tax=Zophobas morio TaxID=2755281 RepID=A0AA38MR42_9CUCU|nr:hypothetical protein Zmor_000816 [Zophobas morio]
MYQLVTVACLINVFDNSEFFQLRACRHGNALMLRLMEMPGWPTNCGSSVFQIARFRVREHLHQWYSIFEIMVPSSLKLTVIRPKNTTS